MKISLGQPLERLLGIGALLLLAAGCAIVLWPFLSALMWAAVICFATWPLYQRVERALAGWKGMAAAFMTLLLAVLIVAPFAFLVATLADSVRNLVNSAANLFDQGPPAPPNWVAGIPVVGESLAAYWQSMAHDAPTFVLELRKVIGPATDIAITVGRVLGGGLVELVLSVLIAFFFYRHGKEMVAYLRASAERVAGPRARHLLTVVGATINGVVYGLIGTALAQAFLAAIGFWIAGVPQALLLGFLTFILSFIPMGPPLVWGSVSLWLLMQGALGWGIFIAAWGLLLISSIDNIIKPYLLGKSNNLPLVLALFGLLGGIIAFGFVGVFLGPALLAVGYNLFLEWHATEVESRPTSNVVRTITD
jgi:predicted PurR-regulated permease PerM